MKNPKTLALGALCLVAVGSLIATGILPTPVSAQDTPPVPKPLALASDSGRLAVSPEIGRQTANFPKPLSDGAIVRLPSAPLLRFTKVGVAAGKLTFTNRITVPANRIVSISAMDPSEMLPNKDGSPSLWAGHTMSILVWEGNTLDLPEECVVLGSEAELSAAWGHLTGATVVSLTYEEKP
jgi:hypothetical protein